MMLQRNDWTRFVETEFGEDDREALAVLGALAGATTGTVREQTLRVFLKDGLDIIEVAAPKPLTSLPAPDPSLEVVTRYRSQLAEFKKVTGKTDAKANAIRDAIWGPFEEGVTDGTIALPSPTTLAGAVAALRCAFDEDTTRAISDKLRDVAIAYLEEGSV